MLIGQSVVAPDREDATYYSPWFPRQGNAFTVVIEVINVSGTITTFDCDVQTKNNEQADGSSTTLTGPMPVTATAGTVSRQRFDKALELVRYRLTLQGSGNQWVHFRSNTPMWEPN